MAPPQSSPPKPTSPLTGKRITRTTPLPERGGALTIAALRHPAQQLAYVAITRLITDLRSLRNDADYFEFQQSLFQHVHETERLQFEAKRMVELERKAKTMQPAPVSTWELELVVLDRIVRQFKTVGDALAWRRLKFRRAAIIALSRDEGGGPMVGKEGLPYELGRVVDIWQTHKHFALLNGLTNCMRVADVTEFEQDHVVLHEVKKNPSKLDPKQQKRMEEVARAVNENVPLRTPAGLVQLWTVKTQLRSRVVPDLRRAIAIAEQQGTTVVGLGEGWVVHCFSATGWPGDAGPDVDVVEDLTRRTRESIEARLHGAVRRVQMFSIDQSGRAGYCVPFTIFPLSPEECAKLTCDYIVFQSIMSSDRIQAAFEIAGFTDVECLLPDMSNAPDPNSHVFRMVLRDRLIQMRATTVAQMLLELVDPKLHAAAWKEALGLHGEPDADQSVSFSNERAIWK